MAGEAKNVRGEGEAGEGGRNLARLPNPGYVVERAATANDGPIRVKQPLDKLVSVDVADVDLLLGFSNGEFVIIPNGALDAVGSGKPERGRQALEDNRDEVRQPLLTLDEVDDWW